METQNVTVTLSVSLLREARHLAIDQGLSLSRFIALLIEERVAGVSRYEQAHQRQVQLMQNADDRGTSGRIDWSRDDLHER